MTPTEQNPAEFGPLDPALEQAVSEMRDQAPDAAVIEAAAARVWARLADQVAELPSNGHHIRGCADFQALLPGYRAGNLPKARATLLKDHLNQCVACRKIYEGNVLPMPALRTARRASNPVRWATAAAVVAAAGLSIWIAVDQYGTRTGHAIVQTVNGTLYEVSPAGIWPVAAGADLPDGIELRTAANSDAMLLLRDGSLVELRERSGVSTTETGSDLTIRLARGSVIVTAAKRRSGHLFVATADCRVSVTGTVFSVSSGVKGSRVSVIQGEVHVSSQNNQDNQEKILHPGEQAVTSPSLEPVAVKDDIAWSRNRDRLLQQLTALHSDLRQIHLPALRYSSSLLGRLPASTVFFVSIPNLAQYLGQAQSVINQKMSESPELREWWSGRGANAEPIIEKLRAASEYLGDEILIVSSGAADGKRAPVFLAEVKREGFADFVKKEVPGLSVEVRPGLAAFGPQAAAVKSLADSLDSPSGFQTTPFYQRVSQSYRDGAGLLLAADLSQIANRQAMAEEPAAGPNGVTNRLAPNRVAMLGLGGRYFIAGEKEVDGQLKATASLEFSGERTGIAAMLAEPAPMGSLDYVSPDATFVTAFAVKNSAAIVDQVMGMIDHLPMVTDKTRSDVQQQTGQNVRNDVAASLGGEFSLSLDGAPFPVPSWKLVSEVYDPTRLQATLQKIVEAHDQDAAKTGNKPLRTSQEVVDGHTYYMIASGDINPLTEVHYTFADGYLIAGPSRVLVSRALQMKTAGTSITHSAQFVAMTPHDHYSHFSALIYEKLGTTLAPLAGLLGAFGPQGGSAQDAVKNLSNIKPMMIAAYGEPDRITIAGAGDLSRGMSNLLTGNLLGGLGNAMPFLQFQGTPQRQTAFK